MTTQHTPTPWKVFQAQAGNATSLMVDGYTVAINLSRRDAEFIKTACNAHNELVTEVARLKARPTITYAPEAQAISDRCTRAEDALRQIASKEIGCSVDAVLLQTIARAALAKAEGQA